MRKKLLHFLAYGCLGITTEVFYTAITDLFNKNSQTLANWSLTGHSYIWMIFIYGSAAFLFPPIYKLLRKVPFLLRIAIYGIGILVVEFIAGFILEALTGKCPWEYHARLAVLGYIRLDYFPLWALFGWVLEIFHKFLNRLHYQ